MALIHISNMKILNLIQAFVFLILITWGCGDYQKQNRWYENAIKYYFQQNHSEDDYYPVKTTLIDQDYLENQTVVANLLDHLQALFTLKMDQVRTFHKQYPSAAPELKNILRSYSGLGKLDTTSFHHYLQFSAQTDLIISQVGQSIPAAQSGLDSLDQVNQEIADSIDQFNQLLAWYNLSVYHLDLSQRDSLLVYQKYRIAETGREEKVEEAIFELDKETQLVIVHKII